MPADRLPASGPSVRARLLIAVVVSAVVLVVVASAVVLVVLRAQLTAGLDDVARARFDALASAVAAGDPSLVADDPSAQLLTADGAVVTGSPALGAAPLLGPSQAADAASAATRATVRRGPATPRATAATVWRVRAGPVRLGRGEAVLVVAADQSAVDRALDRLTLPLALVAAAVLAATTLLAVVGVRRALRPVGVMVERASRASAGADLPVPPGDDEIARLATTLNAVLGRMRASVTRERAFIDDASHELRTPLAVLKGEVELARTSTTYDDLQESLAAAAHEVDRLTDLTDDLLLVAREGAAADEASGLGGAASVEPAGSALRPTDLRVLVPVELRRLASLVPRTTLSIDDSGVGGVTALVAGPDSAWQRVLANLVRNAGGAGAADAVVFLSTTADEVSLVLDDDGPGFADGLAGEDQAGLDRLRRADGARSGSGSGLGLAIVDALVRARRGRVVLDAAPGGGGRVAITVPLARAAAEPDREGG